MTKFNSSQSIPQPKTTTRLSGHTRVPGLEPMQTYSPTHQHISNCQSTEREWTQSDDTRMVSGTLSGLLTRTIAITCIVEVYKLVGSYRVNWSRHFAMFSALWWIRQREIGPLVIGFGSKYNLCLLQWLHHSCLRIVPCLYEIPLSTPFCLSTWWIVNSTGAREWRVRVRGWTRLLSQSHPIM